MSSEPLQVTDDDNESEDLLDTLEEHAARLDNVEGYQEFIKNFVKPKLSELEELRDEQERYDQRLSALEEKFDTLAGLGEGDKSTPQKRALDLRQVMIRRAEGRADGRVALYYQEVLDALRDVGHESLHKPQAYTAMEDAADATGFKEVKITRNGKRVDGVALNLDALPAHARSNEINTTKDSGAVPESADSD